MKNLINILQGEWEGVASESFVAQFESLQPSFNQIYKLIPDIAKQCDNVGDATQALYEEIASKFNIEVSFVAHVFMLSISYYLVY